MKLLLARAVRPGLCAVLAAALLSVLWSPSTPAAASFTGRPIYSEPGAGLQMPPGCQVEPSWRGRLGTSDLEVWVVSCDGETRTWALRRSIVEVLPGNQARLRFQITDERRWPGESAGESASVQCIGRNAGESGFVVLGAKWRAAGTSGQELRLVSATSVLRVDPASQQFVAASLTQVDCTRHPEREAMMRRLQQR